MQTVSSHWFPEGEYGYPAMLAASKGRNFDPEVKLNRDFHSPFSDIFNQPYLGKNVSDCAFISKQPYDIFRARDEIIPDEVSLIVTIRDLRDILLSKHSTVTDMGVDDYFIDADCKYIWRNHEDLRKKGPGLLAYADAINAVSRRRRQKDMKNIFICRYERLVTEPNNVQSELSTLGISYQENRRFTDWDTLAKSHQLEKYHRFRALGEVRSIDKQSMYRWRRPENSERINDQLSKHPELKRHLENFGYIDK